MKPLCWLRAFSVLSVSLCKKGSRDRIRYETQWMPNIKGQRPKAKSQRPGFILPVLFVLLFSATSYAIDVTIPNISSPAEKTFVLEIRTSDVTGAGVFSFDLKIIFDSSILKATDVQSSGTLTGLWGNPTFNTGDGFVRVSTGGTEPLAGSGVLIKILLRVADNAAAGATSPLAFASFIFNEGNPPVNVQNGTFTVINDVVPPVITNGPNTGSITSRSAIITWQTDEPATSVLDYGETTAYGQRITETNPVTNHSATLTGLKAGRTYHFRVSNTDKSGNGPTTSADITFRTKDILISLPDVALDPGAKLIIPVTATDLTDQDVRSVQMVIDFDAELLTATGVITEATLVMDWPAPVFSISAGQIQVNLSSNTPLTGSGTLINLQFTVAQNARIGRKTALTFARIVLNSGDPSVTFRDGSFTVKDTQAPQITSGPQAVDITSSTATILWETNEKAASKVEYGKTTAYGFSEVSSGRVKNHRIALSGLDPLTTFHYRVSSTDSSGNGPVTSSDFSFTTGAGGDIQVRISDAQAAVGATVAIPVQISDVTGQGIYSLTSVVLHDRSLLEIMGVNNSGSLISNWEVPSYELIDGQIVVRCSGTIPMSGSGILYNIVAKVKPGVFDTKTELRFGRLIANTGYPEISPLGGVLTITGHPDVTPPVITYGPFIDQVNNNSCRITWYTDEPADAKIEYGLSPGYGTMIEGSEYATSHSFTINNLNASALYHFQVQSRDKDGNGPVTSQDLTFSTLAAGGVSISIPDISCAAGNSFELQIACGNVSGLEVYSLAAALLYDENILTLQNITSSGTLTSSWGEPVYTATPGRIVIAMGGIKALANSGSLIKMTFSVATDAVEGLRIPIAFEKFVFNESSPAVVLANGSLVVKDIKSPLIEKGPIITALTPTSATVLWATNEPASSLVEYGTSTSYSAQKKSTVLKTGHLMVLSGLEPNTQYHFRVSSIDASGNGPVYASDQTFITPGQQLTQLSLPQIYLSQGETAEVPIKISDVTGQGIKQMSLELVFDAQNISFVRAEAQNTLTANWNAPHAILNGNVLSLDLSGAASLTGTGDLLKLVLRVSQTAPIGSVYSLNFQNVSINGKSANAELKNGSITIRENEPPQITAGPYVNSVTSSTAEIFWITDEPADGMVEYGLTNQLGLTAKHSDFKLQHTIRLENLAPDMQYYFRIACSDSFGNGPTKSAILTLKTLAALEIRVSLPDTTAEAGQEISLPMRISDVSGFNIRSVQFSLLFNQQVVQDIQVEKENSMVSAWATPVTQIQGNLLNCSLHGSDALAGKGILLFLKVKIKSDAIPGASGSLIFSQFDLDDNTHSISTKNGKITLTDRLPPVILSGPFVTEIRSNSVVILWQTDEKSNSIIDYGTTVQYGQRATSADFVREHKILLTGLQTETEYHFQIHSTDAEGNGPVSSTDKTFITAPDEGIQVALADTLGSQGQVLLVPMTIEESSAQDILKFSFEILFNPQIITVQQIVRTGTLTNDWNQVEFTVNDNLLDARFQGSKPLSGSGTLLYLEVKINNDATAGATSALVFTSFIFNDGVPASLPQNGSVRIADDKPPEITLGPVAGSITAVSAEIYWQTNEYGTSIVEYGLNTYYGKKVVDNAYVKEHEIQLTNLVPQTIYHYRVGSRDSINVEPAWSEDQVFKTLGISGIYLALPDTVAGAGDDVLVPVVLQNFENKQILSIDLSILYDPQACQFMDIVSEGTLSSQWGVSTHSQSGQIIHIELSGQTPLVQSGILFYVKLKMSQNLGIGSVYPLVFAGLAVNSGAIEVLSKNGSIQIIDNISPEFTIQPQVQETYFSSALLYWQTNEKTTAEVEFGLTSDYGATASERKLATEHSYILQGLEPSTAYHFRVGIIDSSGNGPVFSNDVMLTTTSGEIRISLPDTTVAAGSYFELPVFVNDITGHNIRNFQCKMTYGQTLDAAGANLEGTLAANWNQPSFSDQGGEIEISASGSLPIAGAGTLFKVGFQVPNNAPVGSSDQISILSLSFNNGNLLADALDTCQITIKESDLQNAVRVSIPDKSAAVNSLIVLPVNVSDLSGFEITMVEFKMNFDSSFLKYAGLDSSTSLLSAWEKPEIAVEENSIHLRAQGVPALADSGTLLRMQFRMMTGHVSGQRTVIKFESFVFNNGFPYAVIKAGIISIVPRRDALAGFVLDRETAAVLDSATVTLNAVADGQWLSTISNQKGYFEFTGLDTTSAFLLAAERRGYVNWQDANPLYAGTDTLKIFLDPKDGYIEGIVREVTSQPVERALIIADDGHGSFGSANSNAKGYFKISMLAKTFPYKVSISKYGFFDQIIENVQANSNLDITLVADYGTISGTVKYADSSAVSQAMMILSDIQDVFSADTTTTDLIGKFVFPQVAAGEYLLVVNKPGYLSEPEQRDIVISPGQRVEANFTLEAAVLKQVIIHGEVQIPNNQSSRFTFSALSENGRRMAINEPDWKIEPAMAGSIDRGLLQPNPRFIGNASIIIVEKETKLSNSLSVEFYAPVGPETDIIFQNDLGVTLQVSPGCFMDEQELRLEIAELAPLKIHSKKATVQGDGFLIKPDELDLASSIKIGLPFKEAFSPRMTIGRWDKQNAEWLISSLDSPGADEHVLHTDISVLGMYAVLMQSEALAIRAISFLPNPFSPDVDSDGDGEAGLTIHLRISSTQVRTPLVSISIYNMLGQLVRDLVQREPFEKEKDNIIHWNGLTDQGLLARNGRYVVKTEVQDPKGQVQNMSAVVLIR
jgi:hypothetical protein